MTGITRLTSDMILAWADDLWGPVALHLKQKLLPVEGEKGIIFPPTYADTDGGYCINVLADGTKVAQIDSVGAQANRMEPLFKRAKAGQPKNPLAALVPQIEIAVGNERTVSILDAGHRLGDALVRCADSDEANAPDLAEEAHQAFELLFHTGDATKVAKLAPTSLVFGAWDSRDTQVKLPRIVQSVIRAWDVDVLRRSAQYNPPVDYAALEVFSEEDKRKAEGDSKSPLAQRGFVHVPSVEAPGGVHVRGDILRDVTINLVALRQLDGENGTALRRYILGLALVAAVAPQDGFLRQGCLLIPDPDAVGQWQLVERDGRRQIVDLTWQVALAYAQSAAATFGVGRDRRATFRKDLAKADLGKKDADQTGKSNGRKSRKQG